MSQQWEYRTMVRTHRTLNKDRDWSKAAPAAARVGGWASGWDMNIAKLLPEIGNEGWELVDISSMTSSFLMEGQPGMVTEEVWVFKRPKE